MVPSTIRIGARIGTADPYWVQMREAIFQRSQLLGIELISIDIGPGSPLTGDEQIAFVEELVVQQLDALICTYLPQELIQRIVSHGLPVVQLTETQLRHQLFVSPHGYYEIAQIASQYIAERLGGHGRVLIVGGLMAAQGEDGRSRIAGSYEQLRRHPQITPHHISSAWRYERAYSQIEAGMRQLGGPIDAILGLSDSLALAARDAGHSLGIVDQHTLIVGINGDPLALAAIAENSMAATVDTGTAEFAAQAVNIACQAARREPLPDHFGYKAQLVTAQNVGEVAVQKLIAIADLPSRLVGVNRQQEQQRLAQFELSREIIQRVGSILNRQQISQEVAELIRDGYDYDTVQLFLWLEAEQLLALDQPDGTRILLDDAGMLGEALRRNELIFVPDAQHSQRFAPSPRWPDTRSRVVVPIRFGGAVLGLLDLHSQRTVQHNRQSLAGLQLLADQLGIAMSNADLYSDALKALASAEKADQLKTRLLANVSHELRTPLNVILGYSQGALESPNPYNTELPPALLHDLGHIYRSGEHLIRLINDLLDLSRAEIDELELLTEMIAPQPFLAEVFQSVAHSLVASSDVDYRLALPTQLPVIQADPVRLRQILLNLLSNACKFTRAGEITLGAEVAPPHLHIWVEDTGDGIAVEMQDRIFMPFVTLNHGDLRPEGIGLGLSITRRLVALHHGTMTLESQPGRGSTFHVYLPLPSLLGQAASGPNGGEPVLLLISRHAETPAIAELCRRQGLTIQRLMPGDNPLELLHRRQPVALAWDLVGAAPGDWVLIEQLRADPHMCQLPFMLYGQEYGAEQQPGVTGIVSKPLQGKTLLDMIEALRRGDSSGPVLIVDDDPQARELYRGMVAQALPSWPVMLADGGQAALEILQREVPSLVLLDLSMPHIDGFGVLQQLRASERTHHVPVLILSGRILSLDDIKRIDHGLVTFHTKDVLAPGETAAALQAALGAHAPLAQPTSRLVKQAIAYIQQHHIRDLSRQQIAEEIGVSKNYLTQIFRQELGISPWEYLNRYRIVQAKALLRSTGDSITVVANQVGFDDVSYFGRVFRKQVGCSPHSYREGVTG